MKGDFSRKTYDPTKHYAGVLMQQGRVQLDADWNEQLGIQRHRDETEALDVIGRCGAPKHDAGFLVTPTPDGLDLILSPGRYYVHGRMCELEGTPVEAVFQTPTQVKVGHWHVDGADFAANQYVELSATGAAPAVVRIQSVTAGASEITFASSIAAFSGATGLKLRRLTTYLSQPDLPKPPFLVQPTPADPPELDLPDGVYLLYLDVWPRHITALVDDLIREKALGGPDTATRVKTVWQVKLWPPPGGAPLPAGTDCGTPVGGWNDLTAPSTGRLNARTKPEPPADPCILPPGAGYLGLENQLYRVEIHEGGVLGTDPITFKWSRDNGSVAKALVKIPGTTDFTVSGTGPDDVLGLANGQWVEQVDDEIDLHAIPRDLFQFAMDPVTGKVTLGFPVDETRHPQLRRWDSNDVVTVPSPPVGDGWIDLENGIQVRFEPGTYRTGDFWVIPARTVLGDIEWRKDGAGNPVPQLRRGIHHAYCRVGVLTVSGGAFTVEDCRTPFPPLTEIKAAKTYSCCTFSVGDGVKYVGDFTLIQEAVDKLPSEGGQICLFPGIYTENVRIQGRRNVHIKGCGPRTRIVSRPPNADGVAAAVIHIVDSRNVKIESLAVEAAPSAPGILADGERPSRGLVIEKVRATAAKDSAIKIRNGEDVTIERCHVEMTDANGRWPGIFLRALDATVRDNEVRGTLREMPPGKIFNLKGSLPVSALQLGGGCERIRVHDNLFHVVSGQGITLGSLVEIGPNGEPVDPNGGGGSVADGDDPCFICDEPSTGDRPPGDGGDDRPPRLRSDGDLYDIDIRRNRIFDVGLDGIGVVHFFDLARTRRAIGAVRIEDLYIVDNRIQRSVRRAFAPIPPNMVDLMAYGGISLSLVDGLVVRDNRIEDVGVGGLLPVCGIFVLYGEGVEVGRNHVLNTALFSRAPEEAGGPGRRGGIHIGFARTLEVASAGVPSELAAVAALPTGVRRLEVAVVVEENTVDVARGQALSLGTFGPASVVSNRLISHGLSPREERPQGQPVLTRLGSLVSIAGLGPTGASGAVNYSFAAAGFAGGRAAARDVVEGANVLFDDNQCLMDLVQGPRGDAAGPGLPPPPIVILSLDDLGFQDNQCDCPIREGELTTAALLVALASVRTVSNRFKETLGRAQFSAVTFAPMNMTTQNQANHCLLVVGPVLSEAKPNHVLISVYKPEYCAAAERRFPEMMSRLFG